MAQTPENPQSEVHASHTMSFNRQDGKSPTQGAPRDIEIPLNLGASTFCMADAEFSKIQQKSAELSTEYFQLDLPSKFTFYPFKTLSVRRVNGRAQGKFTRAAKDKSIRYTVEAVSTLLGDNISAFNLTVQDFYYVMYWLRLASYTKSSFEHIAVCSNENHIDHILDAKRPKAEQKYKPEEWLTEKSLRSLHTISSTQLEETQFDKSKFDYLDFPVLNSLGITLQPALMSDVVSYQEYMTEHELDSKEVEDAANYACYIGARAGKLLPYLDRIEIYNGLLTNALEEIHKFADMIGNYGVNESINVKCSGCSAEIKTVVSISAYDFL